MNTWGIEADFRYFAPRVLDLAASGAMVWPDFQIVCSKLDQARVRTWTQLSVVEEFLRAFWTATMHKDPASFAFIESAAPFRQWLTGGAAADAVIARALQTDDEEFLGQLTQTHDALSYLSWAQPLFLRLRSLMHWRERGADGGGLPRRGPR